MTYSIVPASIRHIRPMSACMRPAGYMAMERYGYNPREALRRAFVSSIHCRTALSDGHPIAMWGVTGALLSDIADVWLILSQEVSRMPHSIVREARAELSRVTADCRDVTATVLPDDDASVRFAVFLGFRTESGKPPGDQDRVPIGDQYVYRLAYRPEKGH